MQLSGVDNKCVAEKTAPRSEGYYQRKRSNTFRASPSRGRPEGRAGAAFAELCGVRRAKCNLQLATSQRRLPCVMRKPRLEIQGGLYHIITRGNNRQLIFGSDDDYRKFLLQLAHQKSKLPFYLYAYCLMPNH